MLSRNYLLELLRDSSENLFNFDQDYSAFNGFNHKNIPRLDLNVDYSVFFKNHLLANIPCILSGHELPWKCFELWRAENRVNYDYLCEKYGDDNVPVAECSKEEYGSHPKRSMTLRQFLVYLQEDASEKECLYVKDYHFMRLHPHDNVFKLPTSFSSDWLNEYYDDTQSDDDYRFVYLGPKNSWTPFHADVLRSYSWSVNIIGRKQWILYPPGFEEKLKDKLGNLPFDVTADKYRSDDKCQGRIEVIQGPGEIIFIPSGWHHQVHNLEETLSINHNWLNGCSVHFSWKYLQDTLRQVEQEISDCKDMEDWHGHCQVLLRAYLGFNYKDFLKLLTDIAFKRINKSTGDENDHHDSFDLLAIKSVLNKMLTDTDIASEYMDIKSLLSRIEKYLTARGYSKS